MTSRLPFVWLLAFCVIVVAPLSAQDQNLDAVRQKADAGDAIAQYDLARAYIAGTGVAKDAQQGIAWLRKSAVQDYVGAEYALGRLYQQGVGLPKDPHEAANWFRKAAKQQNKAAQDQLSGMLALGVITANEANWHTAEPTASQAVSVKSKPAKGGATPFSFAEVETGLHGGITSKRMTTLVQKFGVDFKLSPVTRQRLAGEGADDSLLATISASKRSL